MAIQWVQKGRGAQHAHTHTYTSLHAKKNYKLSRLKVTSDLC